MLKHLETINATKTRTFFLFLVPITLIAIITNSLINTPFDNFQAAIAAIPVVASFLIVLVTSNWIAGDIDNNIAQLLLVKNSSRKDYVVNRMKGVYLLALLVTILYILAAVVVCPPEKLSEFILIFNPIFVSIVYATGASALSFIFKNSIISVSTVLFFIFLWEPILGTLSDNPIVISLLSPESHISKVASASASVFNYGFCILFIVVGLFICHAVFKKSRI
ncbi:MAG: hypothetical protein Q4C74_02515 [Rothia sp. (in: high G+C Gram-positive bacteria)]|nr:hypothetical protein [Rothia sp. (in: high G+C Gram-positive bacteria)]